MSGSGDPRRPSDDAWSGPTLHAGEGIALPVAPIPANEPEPLLGSSVAAVGAVLVAVGILVWTFYYLLDLGSHVSHKAASDSRPLIGVTLALLLLVAGDVIAAMRRTAELDTKGVVSVAFGAPLFVEFLLFDGSRPASALPVALLVISIAGWLVSYVFVPGTTGQPVYLVFSASALWWFAIQRAGVAGSGAVAATSILFGLTYYLSAYGLDRFGRAAIARPFVLAAFPATVLGIIASISDSGQIGTGLLLVFVGLPLASYGGWAARRFTTWAWAVASLLGLGLVIETILRRSPAAGGVTAIVVGVAVIALGHMVKRRGQPSNNAPARADDPAALTAV